MGSPGFSRAEGAVVCGRFNVESDPLSKLLLELVRLRHPGPDNHNAAPTESIVVLRLDDLGEPELVPMRWWLTPYWSKQPGSRYAMFNARSENVDKAPAFRESYRERRCVVPVSGFYEWAKSDTRSSDGKNKVPYYIRPRDLPGLLLAGVWDRWRNRDTGTVLESFAILTTAAGTALEFVHTRQPVMLSLADGRRWLAPDASDDELKSLLGSVIPVDLDAVPVSSYVNNARNKEARCIEPIGMPVAVPAAPT
jgi:putative SOS response-associated peptidase YedK